MDRRDPGRRRRFDRWFDDPAGGLRAGDEWCFATISTEPASRSAAPPTSRAPEHDGLEIGWTWLNPSAWRTGANLEAKLLMLGYAFDDLGCMRVEFKTDARNARSRDALERAGAASRGSSASTC